MTADEKFSPTSGRFPGYVGLAITVGVIATAVIADERGGIEPWGIAFALLVAAVSWTALLKPGMALRDDLLVMRNMFSTVTIPLPAIESVAVRQVTAVTVGEKRYVCAAVGRSRTQLRKDNPAPRPGGGGHSRMGGIGLGAFGLSARAEGGEHEGGRKPKALSYGFYVEEKLRRAVADAKQAARGEPEPAQVRIDWREIAAVGATAIATAVLLAL